MKLYCLIYKPTGEICELERDKTGALICFEVHKTIEAAQASATEGGATDYEVAELPAGIKTLVSLAYQDGGRFYSCFNERELANYSHLVSGDYDLSGAAAARARFLENFPNFTMEG